MKKILVITACFGILIFWMSVMVAAYPASGALQLESVSAPVSLLLLGSVLCALSFWCKRPKL